MWDLEQWPEYLVRRERDRMPQLLLMLTCQKRKKSSPRKRHKKKNQIHLRFQENECLHISKVIVLLTFKSELNREITSLGGFLRKIERGSNQPTQLVNTASCHISCPITDAGLRGAARRLQIIEQMTFFSALIMLKRVKKKKSV